MTRSCRGQRASPTSGARASAPNVSRSSRRSATERLPTPVGTSATITQRSSRLPLRTPPPHSRSPRKRLHSAGQALPRSSRADSCLCPLCLLRRREIQRTSAWTLYTVYARARMGTENVDNPLALGTIVLPLGKNPAPAVGTVLGAVRGPGPVVFDVIDVLWHLLHPPRFDHELEDLRRRDILRLVDDCWHLYTTL